VHVVFHSCVGNLSDNCLDGESIESSDNGIDGIYFFDDRAQWEPFTYVRNVAKGQFDAQIIASVNFIDAELTVEEQQLFLKLWVHGVFFGSVQPTKIILLLLGEQGSGKTSALRRIQKLIFGPKVDLLSIEKDKQDGFIATITADPIALFDNLDEVPWLPYNLSRLATGITFSRRHDERQSRISRRELARDYIALAAFHAKAS
jgi:predicted Ser/Thr protein kinase